MLGQPTVMFRTQPHELSGPAAAAASAAAAAVAAASGPSQRIVVQAAARAAASAAAYSAAQEMNAGASRWCEIPCQLPKQPPLWLLSSQPPVFLPITV